MKIREAHLTPPRLFRPTKDLGSILTTFNYGLYLLAYFDAKAHKFKSHTLSLLTILTKSPTAAALVGHPEAELSPFAKLGKVVYNARTTLRLFGLLPIYVRARKLMIGSQNMDKVLWAIEAVQCSLFATFQLLENVAFSQGQRDPVAAGGPRGRRDRGGGV